MSEQEYLKTRIDDQIKWYSDKATRNKKLHHWTKALVILFSSFIPFIAGVELEATAKNSILGLLGTFIAILSGLSGLLKFQEKWSAYRTTSETLKHEKILFQTLTGEYDNKQDPFKLLVTRIENLIGKEHSTWSESINKKKKLII